VPNSCLREFNRFSGKVYAHKLATRKAVRHGNQVAAVAASNLQNTAMFDRHGIHPKQRAHDGKPVRMRLQKSETGIRHAVIQVRRGIHAGYVNAFCFDREPRTAAAAHLAANRSRYRATGRHSTPTGSAATATLAKPILRYHPQFASSWQVQTLPKQAER
jgi:hypothetical protein